MPELSAESFTKNLKRLRTSHGLTQEGLAEKIDVAPSTINRWESGNVPSFIDFYKVMRVFGVTFEELAGFKEVESFGKMVTIEEALKVLADETGIILKLPKGVKKEKSILDSKISQLDEKRLEILNKTVDQLILSQSTNQKAN